MTQAELAHMRLLTDAILLITGGTHSRDESNIATQLRNSMQRLERREEAFPDYPAPPPQPHEPGGSGYPPTVAQTWADEARRQQRYQEACNGLAGNVTSNDGGWI